MRLPDPPLLLVTDRKQARLPLAAVVERALAAGCRWVSIREKDLPEPEQRELARVLKPLALAFAARLTLHGHDKLATAAGVDGVHLPAGGDVAAARAALGTTALIGISIHSVAEAERLDRDLVDYAVAGPAFATLSKPGYGPVLDAGGILAMARATSVPIIAIGGIEPANVHEVVASGASGIAVMGSVMRAAEPENAVGALIAALKKSSRQPRPR